MYKRQGRKFAIIIDEAHSSQSGKAHAKMKLALSGLNDAQIDAEMQAAAKEEAAEQVDAQDTLVQEMNAQGRLPNLSFFAFTATPKPSTLEVFGHIGEMCIRDRSPGEHHDVLTGKLLEVDVPQPRYCLLYTSY